MCDKCILLHVTVSKFMRYLDYYGDLFPLMLANYSISRDSDKSESGKHYFL